MEIMQLAQTEFLSSLSHGLSWVVLYSSLHVERSQLPLWLLLSVSGDMVMVMVMLCLRYVALNRIVIRCRV